MIDFFEELRRAIANGQRPACDQFPPGPMQRLARMLCTKSAGESIGVGDFASAVRCLLRSEQERLRSDLPVYLDLPKTSEWPNADTWELFHCNAHEKGKHWRIEARSWNPHWLPAVNGEALDADLFRETLRRADETVLGDPFLSPLGYQNGYRSAAQRDAVRSVLAAPPGSTLVVNLPTGEGKSLCAHALSSINNKDALVVVVVPTTALAIDQEAAARHLVGHATAYFSSHTAEVQSRNQSIRERIRNGSQKLLFTSPESIAGALSASLELAARSGLLRALIIDEVHMINEWGDDFRSAFQELPGFRRRLLNLSPIGAQFVTVLMSATLIESTLDMLHLLFGAPGSFRVYSSVRLRPEPAWWSKNAGFEKQKRVLDAIRSLPRPLILYLNRPKQAEEWLQILRDNGFYRATVIVGNTPNDQRLRILRDWRDDKLDIIVGNSAFGLGVDKADVRAVIHAAIPGTLDRFYQEVGRGGRDGRAAISLLLFEDEDWREASRINRKTLIGEDRGLQRWKSMFERATSGGPSLLRIPIDAPPGQTHGDIDMRNQLSRKWNIRTLTQMARAGLIELDPDPKLVSDREAPNRVALSVEDTWNYRFVRILNHDHLSPSEWNRRVGAVRMRTYREQDRSLELLSEVVKGPTCVAQTFADLYSIPANEVHTAINPALSCGGCPFCRSNRIKPYVNFRPRSQPPWPAFSEVGSGLRKHLGSSNRLAIFYPPPDKLRWSRRRNELVFWLIQQGIRNIVAPKSVADAWWEKLAGTNAFLFSGQGQASGKNISLKLSTCAKAP